MSRSFPEQGALLSACLDLTPWWTENKLEIVTLLEELMFCGRGQITRVIDGRATQRAVRVCRKGYLRRCYLMTSAWVPYPEGLEPSADIVQKSA